MAGITLVNNNIIPGILEYKKLTNMLPPYVQIFTHNLDGKEILTNEQEKELALLKDNQSKIFVHSTFNTVITKHWSIKKFMLQYNKVVENKYDGIVLHFPASYDVNMMSVLRLYFGKITEMNYDYYPTIYFEHVVNPTQYLIKPLELVNQVRAIKDTCRVINPKINIGICVDTCHVYSSGLPLGDLSDVMRYMSIIDKSGLPILIHLNDSMNEFNSKKDRHGPIGTYIWIESLDAPKYLLKYPNVIELAEPMSSVKLLLSG